MKRARLRVQARADDRAHPRRARRADDLRPEAGALVRRAARATATGWRARARRIAVGKLSGAVGTFSHLPPEVEEAVCERLGLVAGADRVAGAAARPPRRGDDHAGPPGRGPRDASPPRSAPCRRPRCARWRSRSGRSRRAPRPCPTSATRWAASRSPAWRGCCARNALAALENVALWHERDISHSSVERVIVPDSFLALDHMLRRFTDIVRGHDRAHRAHAPQPGVDARPRVLRPAPAGADRARACGARTPTASCRATPWRPGERRATSRSAWPPTPRSGPC